MITQPALPEAHHRDEPGTAGIGAQSIAGLVAAAVCGLHRLNDDFVRVNAALGDDGYIHVEVTRVNFAGEDVTERVLLYPTAPVPIPPRTGPGPRGAA
ncbi:MAG: hypothetical protein ACRDRA_20485 [Pseudonocardiaceae bacterium]